MTPEMTAAFAETLWDIDVTGAIAFEQLQLQRTNDRDSAHYMLDYFGIPWPQFVEPPENYDEAHLALQHYYTTIFGDTDEQEL